MIFMNRSIRKYFVLLILLVLFLDCAVYVSPVSAATIVVDTNEDQNNTDIEHCSLREAITAAKIDDDFGGCSAGSGADIITLPADNYTLSGQLPYISGDITINGAGAASTIIEANACNPVEETCTHTNLIFWVFDSGTLTLNDLTLQHGRNINNNNGGVMFSDGSVTINNCIITANKGTYGGAIRNYYAGIMTISNSTISYSIADPSGGGFFNDGTLTITNSTFLENSTINGGGGAIYNYTGDYGVGSLTITNSTFSGNNAATNGGAIANIGGGTLTLINTTLSVNTGSTGAGIYNDGDSTLNFTNSIIANSITGSDCTNSGTIGTNVNNLVEDGTCSPAISGDPSLGALADNGGPTQTHALLMGSTAIDAGNLGACPGADQRGVARPKGSGCDIGAFEFYPAVADMTGTPTSGVAPLEVMFTNNSTGEYDTCLWDFGDSTTSDECDPSPHTYTDAGVYTVSLTVSGLGGSDTKTLEDYISVYSPVVADFSGSPTNGIAPLEVNFTNNSTGDYDTCLWDFGDTTTSSECNPSPHTYTDAGVYTVSLTVSGLGGSDTMTKADYISVEELPAHECFLPLVVK